MSTERFKFNELLRVGDDWWKVGEREMPEYGLCDYEEQTIWINPTQSKAEAKRTLLHEIIHACCNALNEETVNKIELTVKHSGLL